MRQNLSKDFDQGIWVLVYKFPFRHYSVSPKANNAKVLRNVLSAGRIVTETSYASASLPNEYNKLPCDTKGMQQTVEDFFSTANFPKVIGAIDCTHIRIQSPGKNNGEIIICPSTSKLFILGDSGYKQFKYMKIPLQNPRTRPKNLYNESQIRTCNTTDKCFRVGQCVFQYYLLVCD
ncbi:hypothetical protein CVS40_10373 [Lucilia cuprina]|nr:hypothetical protein CVS40_10373 [Lucilia cuprina]